MEIEQTAISLGLIQGEQQVFKAKRSKINMRMIQQLRNPTKVVDLLKLRLGYLRKKEEVVRASYKRLREKVKSVFGERQNRFKRIVKSIAKRNTLRWKLGIEENKQKTEWLERKF